MAVPISEAAWVDRFMTRLGELVTTMKPADAIHHAHEVCGDAHDLEPEEAAEIYALECPPGECAEPGE